MSTKKVAEVVIENRLKREIEGRLKGLCLKFLPWHFTGFPDRICLIPGGVVFFVETKAPGKKLESRQAYVRRQLARLGFEAYRIDSVESIEILIRKYTNA